MIWLEMIPISASLRHGLAQWAGLYSADNGRDWYEHGLGLFESLTQELGGQWQLIWEQQP